MHFVRIWFAVLTAFCAIFAAQISTGNGEAKGQVPGELVEREAIMDRVKDRIAERDFQALNAMESEFRISRARTPSGTWKLASFHAAAPYYIKQAAGITDGCDFSSAYVLIENWKAVDKNQPAPFLAEAQLLFDQASCYRGAGPGYSVSPEDSRSFRRLADKAAQLLEQNKIIASIDPEYYAVMVEIYRAQGRKKADLRALLDEGTAREPYYYSIYFKAFYYYQPQWYGSPEEVEQLARYAAEKTHAQDGDGAYARLYWYSTECGCRVDHYAPDWGMMKQGMRDVIKQFPEDWNASHFAKFACQMGYGLEADMYLQSLSKNDGSAWSDPNEWKACMRFATGERNLAVRPR